MVALQDSSTGYDARGAEGSLGRRSVFYDLFPPDEAAGLEMRSLLLMGLEEWLAHSKLTRVRAAKVLGITQARLSDLRRNGINKFTLDELVRLAARARLRPELSLAA